jgi:heparanase
MVLRWCAVLIGSSAACQSKTKMPESPEPLARAAPGAAPAVLATAGMPRVGTVDERYQSYNVEMLEVTGGKFWRSYASSTDAAPQKRQRSTPPAKPASSPDTPPGMDPELYEYRPPIDLGNARLQALAAGLGPAYVRVSGTWANSTYFPASAAAPKRAPPGFNAVLTQEQWRAVIDFSRAVDADIVTSFAISAGTRDARGVWTPAQAQRVLDYTRSAGSRISAAEFMNEPNLAAMGGAPQAYDGQAYGRDFEVFRSFVKQAAPDLLIVGPGSAGETTASTGGLTYGTAGVIPTRDLLVGAGRGVDVFSYHHYGAASQRCTAMGMPSTTAEAALGEEWLGRTDSTLAFYRALRDEFEPGKPLWLTETADTACGGNPWASTFLDSFRYLDQLGRLAKQGVQMVAHNTLVASDYGLLDDKTLTPKPNYWAALLWRRLMGATVLDARIPLAQGQHVYAHCLRGRPGGVALLIINNDTEQPQTFRVPVASERYTLHASELQSRQVQLNGSELTLQNDALPALTGTPHLAGDLTFAPATITFLAVTDMENPACK